MKKTSKKGFTLIELLVVMSIIGLLSSIVLAGLNSAKIKARNSYINQLVRQYQIALTSYYYDHNYYPPSHNSANGSYAGCLDQSTCLVFGNTWPQSTDLITALGPYVSAIVPISSNILTYYGLTFRGLFYSCTQSNDFSNQCGSGYILWPLQDTSSCDVSGAINYDISPEGNITCYLYFP